LAADGEEGAEVYSAAASRDQATLVYREMREMVKQVPRLKARCRWFDSVKRIIFTTRSGAENVYQALSADADYSDGINPSAVIVDELHRHKTRDLYDLLNEGGGTRKQPLTIVITTAGYDKTSVCHEEWEYARKVRDGVVVDPTFLPIIYEMSLDADWHDEREWFKCNPALGDFLDIEDLRKSVREATEKPAMQNSVLRLRFNQWTAAESRWFTRRAWDSCGGVLNEHELVGRPCFGGLDLASTSDFTSWLLVFPDDGHRVIARHFLPRAAVDKRSPIRDQLAAWERSGDLFVTPGDVTDYDFVKAQILKDAARYEIREIGFDPWSAAQMSVQLESEGLTLVPVRQGFATLSSPSKFLETLVNRGQLNHGGAPVLRWMADNVQVERDADDNIKPSKKHSSEKIDGIAALVNAIERSMHATVVPQVAFMAFD
jgi:phage terminase large subunit-like protein